MERTDWKIFTELTREDKDVNEVVYTFNEMVCAAKDSIPQTKGMPSRRPVP